MRLSPMEEYGLRCILRLAEKRDLGQSRVEEIAKAEGMSVAYVEKVLLHLKKAGLVSSTRGSLGGYILAKPPSQISIGAVMRAMDGTILSDLCDRFPGEHEECVHLRECSIRPIWVVLAHHLYKILDSVSLTDLMRMEGEKSIRNELYHRFPVAEPFFAIGNLTTL